MLPPEQFSCLLSSYLLIHGVSVFIDTLLKVKEGAPVSTGRSMISFVSA